MNEDTAGQIRNVDVPTLLTSIANQLSQNRTQLNGVDGAGTHGERIAQAFTAAAQAAGNTSGDAGAQLQAAAQAMKSRGAGKASQFYANGLLSAAQQFKGKSDISSNDLVPFLQSFVGGVQQNNPAKPGQGTMIDALNPALTALTSAQGQGQDTVGAMSSALGAAITGTQKTAGARGVVDPGAASATNVLGGIFSAIAPMLLSTVMGRITGGGSQSQSDMSGGTGGAGGLGSILGGLLGGGMGNSQQSQGSSDSGLGGLLGGLMGGGDTTTTSVPDTGQSGGGWLGGLLGGLAGGTDQSQGGGAGMGGLGGLLGGLMGGQDTSGQGTTTTNYSDQNQSGQQGGDSGLGGLLGGMFGNKNN